MKSGMEDTPPTFEKPVLRDPFFWLFIATLVLWAVIFGFIFL